MKWPIYQYIFMALAIIACNNESAEKKNTGQYLDVKEIVKHIGHVFTATNPFIRKITIINAQSSDTIMKIIKWNDELAPFYAIDLNKPAYRNSYGTVTKINDTCYVNFYLRGRREKKSDIDLVSATFSNSNKLRSIFAKAEHHNMIYQTERAYELVFDTIAHPRLKLVSYKLEGSQGFKWLGKKDNYTVMGIVLDKSSNNLK